MPQQPPTPGRIVLYQLTSDDARRITHQRTHSGQTGNFVEEGQQYPAIIVRAFPGNPDGACNLRVLLDGEDAGLWATSRREGTEPGTWSWPARV